MARSVTRIGVIRVPSRGACRLRALGHRVGHVGFAERAAVAKGNTVAKLHGSSRGQLRAREQRRTRVGGNAMKTRASLGLVLVLLLTGPAFAQQRGHVREESRPRANAGRIPAPPAQRSEPHATPEAEHHGDRINAMPHVGEGRWFGHDEPGDPRYRLERPFAHGHFERFGPSHRHQVVRVDRRHHDCVVDDEFVFEIAVWDWPIWSGWCWDCGDDFVIYEDLDHDGWYLLYDVHTGGFVHAQFLGRD